MRHGLGWKALRAMSGVGCCKAQLTTGKARSTPCIWTQFSPGDLELHLSLPKMPQACACLTLHLGEGQEAPRGERASECIKESRAKRLPLAPGQ